LQKKKPLEDKTASEEPIVVRHLLNPLLWHGNNICTISVFVFVESFESLRSYIFNNVKVRFRQQKDFKEDEDFATSGFGRGNTLFRFTLNDLIKLLHRREGSKLESMEEQKKVFWNRVCQKVVLVLLLMKT